VVDGEGSVLLLSNVVDISAAERHTCALLTDGTIKCWGTNNYGELGANVMDSAYSPVELAGLSGAAVALSVGANNVCAVISGGTVQCLGRGDYGELGDGNNAGNSNVPVTVLDSAGETPLSGVTAISVGMWQTCAIISGGTLQCWGYNNDNVGTVSSLPVEVSGITNAVSIGLGEYQACAVLSGGTAKCWGYNNSGLLGDGTTNDSDTPVDVLNVTGATDVSAGEYRTCVNTAGGLMCWGADLYFMQD
jgi:alpha-tubulin suppressor-like RCC1 family protein